MAVIVGTWPQVSPAMVRAFLAEQFGIVDASVCHHELEDFVVRFSNYADMGGSCKPGCMTPLSPHLAPVEEDHDGDC